MKESVMLMKRFYMLLLTLVLLVSLAACGGEEVVTEVEGDEVVEVQPPREEEIETLEPEVEIEPAPEPEPEPEPQPQQPAANGGSNKPATIPQSEKAYLVRINLTHCTVNIFGKDESGEYTVPAKAMICSTGYATPKAGTFYRIGNTWEWLRLKGNVYGHYVTQITGNILFHSVPYLRWGDPASLEYWEFDKLGVKASQGCIRLQVSDAIWIYNNAWNIVGVEFYADEDPGPFGKPTAPKISDNEFCRDWDPTDPDPNNPWHDFVDSGVEEGIDPETGLPIEPVEGEETVTDPVEGEIGEAPAEGDANTDVPAEEGAGENPEGSSETPADSTTEPETPAEAPTESADETAEAAA